MSMLKSIGWIKMKAVNFVLHVTDHQELSF